MSFDDANAKNANRPYYWVDIEGLRKRYGTYSPSWNPADTGTNRHIETFLADVPTIGGQEADPVNGTCEIPSHRFSILDVDGAITALVSVSDTPWVQTYLTESIDTSQTTIAVEDSSEFSAGDIIYLDRETIVVGAISTSKSASGTADLEDSAGTATGGTKLTMTDMSHTEESNYWVGAVVTFTSGTNNGESRTIRQHYYDEDLLKGVFYWDSPLPAAVGSGDTFTLTSAPDKMKDSARTEANGYWDGARITITGGTNAGLVRWVDSFDSSTDTFTLCNPFPTPCDATSTYSIGSDEFTGCTRGAFGSTASAHVVTNNDGSLTKRKVSTKVPFLKTRKCTIYENRVGEDESEAIANIGYIDNYSLTHNANAYTFECSGVLRLLSKKLLSKQGKSKVRKYALWGGLVDEETFRYAEKHSSQNTKNTENQFWSHMILADGRTDGFTVKTIYFNPEDENDFTESGGNIKIDDEIIHYSARSRNVHGYVVDPLPVLRLGNSTQDNDTAGDNKAGRAERLYAKAALYSRGLFSDKIGLPDLIRNVAYRFGPNRTPVEVSALMDEHEIGAEIVECCVCDDSWVSDFPRYDWITYSSLSGGSFSVGNIITGGTSGVVATVMHVEETGTSGELVVAFADPATDEFEVSEIITQGGVSAQIDWYEQEMRHRNNAIDAALQLMLSTGIASANGKFDTLPEGIGAGIDEDMIDVAGIEELRDKYFGSISVDFVLHEPISAKEWLEENIFRPLQIFPYETSSGKISLAALMTEEEARIINAASSLEAFGDSQNTAIPLPDWTSGQPPISKMMIKYNKHPTKNEYLGEIELIFGFTSEWYLDMGRTIELELDSFYFPDNDFKRVAHNDARLPGLIRRLSAVLWDRQAQYPCPVIDVTTDYSLIKTNIGDPVLFTSTGLPNLKTSLRGIGSEFFQVVGKRPNPKTGVISWTLWQIGVHDNKYARRTPSAVVYDYDADTPSAGKSTITCVASYFSPYGDPDVGYFSAGQEIMIVTDAWVPIAGATPEKATIESIDSANNKIILDQNLTNTPSGGETVEWADFDNATSGQQEGGTYVADKDHVIGTDGDSAYKYQ